LRFTAGRRNGTANRRPMVCARSARIERDAGATGCRGGIR
jgi:hypothetical protein